MGWLWVVDAQGGDRRRYIVESDELLSAFLELESHAAVTSAKIHKSVFDYNQQVE